jgi:hypothetical protein
MTKSSAKTEKTKIISESAVKKRKLIDDELTTNSLQSK